MFNETPYEKSVDYSPTPRRPWRFERPCFVSVQSMSQRLVGWIGGLCGLRLAAVGCAAILSFVCRIALCVRRPIYDAPGIMIVIRGKRTEETGSTGLGLNDRHVSFLAVLIVEFFSLNYSVHYSLIDTIRRRINRGNVVRGQCITSMNPYCQGTLRPC